MFHWCAEYPRVWVTGPQRSGTSICARMICHDTGYEYVDGVPINTWTAKRLRKEFGQREGIVIQCPFAAHMIDQVVAGDPNELVVFLYRDLGDILRSQGCIGWHDRKSLRRYPGSTFETVAARKYELWENETRDKVPTYAEIRYENLRPHPLFVEREDRKGWSARQWQAQA